MNSAALTLARARQLLNQAGQLRVLVLGDVMLDQFLWGRVSRISPEAPVPVVEFDRESFMPGGAANVARNLADLQVPTELFGVIGADDAGLKLKELLSAQGIGARGLLTAPDRNTSIKTRIVAHQQQVVRVDRETRRPLDENMRQRFLAALDRQWASLDAVIVADYAKGVVTQPLLDAIKERCRKRGLWLSMDPKPNHKLELSGLSLITPNRKEAFELAETKDEGRGDTPLADERLQHVAGKLLHTLKPALLLITLGDQGMLLCQRGQAPFHIPTVAREVFDVSGAGDTVIAAFTLAIAAGASPLEAAMFSNHAAGVVVAKVGTATAQPNELLARFQERA